MSVRIGLGAAGLPFSGPAAFGRWLEYCDESGIDSVWFSDRLISPAPLLEPMTAMSFVAGRTRHLKFGMNAIVLPLRDPLVLAKECATLDYLSGGRLLPVFGVGREHTIEFGATHRPAAGRGTLADEMIRIMRQLWAGEHVTHEGKYFHYNDVHVSPLPVQQPLPLWIAGSSDAAVRRTARYGTGWLGGIESVEHTARVVRKIRAASSEAGRPLDDDHYGAGFSFRFGSWSDPGVERAAEGFVRLNPALDPRQYLAVGGADEIVERVEQYIAAGVSKFVLRCVADGDEEIMAQTKRLIDEVLPRVHGRN